MSERAPALTLFDLRYGKFVRGLDEERQCSAHKPARANSAKAMNETILLLASDWGIRNVICKALESQGYSVLSASNLGAAADLLKAHTFDLLMVRPYTESVSGYDAAKYLRRHAPKFPFSLWLAFLMMLSLKIGRPYRSLRFFRSHSKRWSCSIK